jgi:hypothetical protein
MKTSGNLIFNALFLSIIAYGWCKKCSRICNVNLDFEGETTPFTTEISVLMGVERVFEGYFSL